MPDSTDVQATLSLGGNIGEPARQFAAALNALEADERVHVAATSSVWRSPPWGKTDQPDFLNMAISIETTLSPHELLTLCLAIERAAGRVRRERWGPRTLDIDIITYGDIAVTEPDLVIPHTRAHERAFVLIPLAEIAGDLKLGGASVASLAAEANKAGIYVDEAATRLVTSRGR